jgi:hypothetical protein
MHAAMWRFLRIGYEYFTLYIPLTLLGLICLTWPQGALQSRWLEGSTNG